MGTYAEEYGAASISKWKTKMGKPRKFMKNTSNRGCDQNQRARWQTRNCQLNEGS